jgi:hypothetical protein
MWQQDHNGFTHQDPGFLDHVVNKKADIVRVCPPPDANCLLSVLDHLTGARWWVRHGHMPTYSTLNIGAQTAMIILPSAQCSKERSP